MLNDEQYLKIAHDYFADVDERHYLFAQDIIAAVTKPVSPLPEIASEPISDDIVWPEVPSVTRTYILKESHDALCAAAYENGKREATPSPVPLKYCKASPDGRCIALHDDTKDCCAPDCQAVPLGEPAQTELEMISGESHR